MNPDKAITRRKFFRIAGAATSASVFSASAFKRNASAAKTQASKDELTGKVLNSIWQFQKQAADWSKVSLQPYLKVRDQA